MREAPGEAPGEAMRSRRLAWPVWRGGLGDQVAGRAIRLPGGRDPIGVAGSGATGSNFGSIAEPGLGEDVLQVLVDRPCADPESEADLGVAEPRRHERHDIVLARGEASRAAHPGNVEALLERDRGAQAATGRRSASRRWSSDAEKSPPCRFMATQMRRSGSIGIENATWWSNPRTRKSSP